MFKAIVAAVVGGGVVTLAGYLLIVKENQVTITHIKQELKEIKDIGKKNQDSLVATKLFIAQAHPDRDASNLASIMKLQRLNKQEIAILAESLPKVKLASGPSNEVTSLPKSLKALAKKHNLSGDDLAAFTAVANLPARDHKL